MASTKTKGSGRSGRPAVFPELGVSGLRRFSGYVYEEFLPELRGRRGMQVYREMRDNSAKVGAALGAAEMTALGVNWWVEPGENDTDAVNRATFVEQCRQDMSESWRDLIREALTMLPFGFAPLEIVYKRRSGFTSDPRGRSHFDDGLIGWRKFPLRAQETVQRWEIDDEGGIQGLYQQAPPKYATTFIPIEKLLLFRTRAERNNPEGRSVLRNAYECYWRLKRIKDTLCIGIERDLNGIPVVRVPSEVLKGDTTETKAARDDYFKMAKNIRQDEQAGIVIPSDADEGGHPHYNVELLATTGRRQFDLVATIEYFESCIVASILYDLLMGGQPNTIQYRGDSRPDMFASAISGWLDIITDIFNAHAIPRLYRLNGWDTRSCARLRHGEVKAPDLAKVADFVSKTTPAGLLTPDPKLEQHLRRLVGFPERDNTAPLIPRPEGDPEAPPPDDLDAEDAPPSASLDAGKRVKAKKGGSLNERLGDRRPLRLGEFADLTGYSREQVRKWADTGALATVKPIGDERRVPVDEARRLAAELGIFEQKECA
jgi:hypothetical protein